MSTPSANDSLEYLRIGFAFSGALLGSILGTPLIEWFKDQLGARRHWKSQRSEIIGTVRLVTGILSGFHEMRIEAFGRLETVELSESALARLAMFDFALLDDSLVKLAALHPADSSRSAAAQRLIQHIVVLKSYFQQLQSVQAVALTRIPDKTSCLSLSSSDREILEGSDNKYVAFQRFLGGIYARRLEIDPISLTTDREIINFERALKEHDVNETLEKARRLFAKYKESKSESDV